MNQMFGLAVPEGCSVRIKHTRIAERIEPTLSGELKFIVSGKGGATHCILIDEESQLLLAMTTARCNPKDNFNRKIGRAIATGRMAKFLAAKGTA